MLSSWRRTRGEIRLGFGGEDSVKCELSTISFSSLCAEISLQGVAVVAHKTRSDYLLTPLLRS